MTALLTSGSEVRALHGSPEFFQSCSKGTLANTSLPEPTSQLSFRTRLMLVAISCLLVVAVSKVPFEPNAHAATTFVVTTVNDSGSGSLRQAILDANSNPGSDVINFNIGSGHQTIKPLTRLPFITDTVVIDGSTQPGFSGSPIIEIDSSNLVEGHGLFFDSANNTIRSLVINNSHFDGIALGAKGGNRVEGCYIGTDVTGTVARPNGGSGISLSGSNNIIGGVTTATRNVISGNNGSGVDVARFCCTGNDSPITGNVIKGNYIGVNVSGSAAIANRREGIRITSVNANVPVTGNFVGGTEAGAGNVVSGNLSDGIRLDGFHVANNTVQGNFVGTDSTGAFPISNDGDGVFVTGSNNLIGGATTSARNIISGNGRSGSGLDRGNGISLLSGSGNVVKGNIIGANASLTGSISNLLHGITIGGTNSVIGGVNAGEGNVIAFNGYDGIISAVPASTGNSFRGNSIFSNGFHNHPDNVSIGIDVGGFGVSINDAGDTDTGSNNVQNFPVITSITPAANSTNIKGTLNSAPSTTFALDFYANSVCDALEHGEGARRLGSASVSTNTSGDGSFDVNLPIALLPGEVLTATATDPTGNTSEFSRCTAASPSRGSVSFNAIAIAVPETAGVASFTVTRTGGAFGSLTVNFAVRGQTATAGSDFTPTEGTLIFADGETSKMFTVPILDDNVDEFINETALVTLSTSGDLDTLGSRSSASLTINDDEPLPSVSVGDVSVNEGNSGTRIAFFTISLSAASGKIISIGYATANGTASSADYVSSSATLVFNPGETSKTIEISINGDVENEANETFLVNLHSAVNVNIGRVQGTGTILNDDGGTVPLQLVGDESGPGPIQATALESALLFRDPFQVLNASAFYSQKPDRNTRVTLFLSNLQLQPGQPASSVQVSLVDSNYQTYNVSAEDVRTVEGFSFTQVVFRLPDNLAPGVCTVRVVANGQSSNSGTFRIRP